MSEFRRQLGYRIITETSVTAMYPCVVFYFYPFALFSIDFSCAIASTLAMHGRMYPTSSHVCFYSNVFGRERKVGIVRRRKSDEVLALHVPPTLTLSWLFGTADNLNVVLSRVVCRLCLFAARTDPDSVRVNS